MRKFIFLILFAVPLFAQHTDMGIIFGTTLSSDGTTVTGKTTTTSNAGVYYSDVNRFDLVQGTYGVAANLTQLTGTNTYRLEVRLYSATVGFGDWNDVLAAGQHTNTLNDFTYTTESWWKAWASGTQYRLTMSGTGTTEIKVTETVR